MMEIGPAIQRKDRPAGMRLNRGSDSLSRFRSRLRHETSGILSDFEEEEADISILQHHSIW
jgi:hypothetical protein